MEQVRTLEGERNTLASPLLHESDLDIVPNVRGMGLIDLEFKHRIAAVRVRKNQHCDALTALDDPQRRRQLLDQLAAEQRDNDLDAVSAAFDSFSTTATLPHRVADFHRQPVQRLIDSH
ncbi:MAG: hypothetical protein CVV12_03825 [Gammaproteobacteria bacterium HGW-Gammaproteobacteria-2]|jgi:hypothetical protein|nr:MAG: hypothetical protein CVV12_03825 [Gammaproteobacteria bacterium HGW-Gammaproteobacteria-2]